MQIKSMYGPPYLPCPSRFLPDEQKWGFLEQGLPWKIICRSPGLAVIADATSEWLKRNAKWCVVN